jgi:hypothetical protein
LLFTNLKRDFKEDISIYDSLLAHARWNKVSLKV